jgi:phosphatidate cytidylyltransferase
MANKKFFYSNIFARTITTLILAPIILYFTYQGGIFFDAIIITITAMMAFEWSALTSSNKRLMWKIIGLVYIAAPCVSMIYLINTIQGSAIITWLMLTVWITDIAAFFSGKIIGGPKLVPTISPNKTWAGFIGALIAALLLGFVIAEYLQPISTINLIFATIIISIAALVGDLLESWIKRQFHIKDSGKIIPGHGGILDRVDGFIIASPVMVLIVIFYGDCLF